MTMLRLDLARLHREGSVELDAQLPGTSAFWEGSGVEWDGSVEVKLTASLAGSREIVVRGHLNGRLKQECKRCLEPVGSAMEHELTLVFVSADEEGAEEDDGVHLYGQGTEIDLSNAVREEVVFAVDPYVICRSDCEGLCSRCGINRNKQKCNCTEDHTDPRWEALRVLKEK